MKFDYHFKLKSKHLMWLLAALGFALIAMAVLGLLGVKIPPKLASDVSNGVIIGALVVFFYNRKIRAEEAKAKAAEKAREAALLAGTTEGDASSEADV
jgi:uncharacterized membrane protein